MIKDNVHNILASLPPHVELLAACKGRTGLEIKEAINAGINIIGHNYIKEREETLRLLLRHKALADRNDIKCHFIGHLQKNKVKKAIKLFDLIETVDSFSLAELIDKEAKKEKRIMPVFIEINSAEEKQKFGILPYETKSLIDKIKTLEYVKVTGIMTMGPLLENVEDIRPYFKDTKKLFDEVKVNNPEIKYLSMGMSDSYKIAIEEGANLVRIGRMIFNGI